MEEFHQLQKQPKGVSPYKQGKHYPYTRTGSNICKSKFVGVRQRPSGKWVAEIKDSTQKIRMWLGTFPTPEEAARAYDEAACLLRGANIRTNFATHVSSNSPVSIKVRNLLNLKRKSLNQNSSTTLATKTNIKATTLVIPSFKSSISGSDIFLPNGADVSLLSNNRDGSIPCDSAGTIYSFCNEAKQVVRMFYDACRPDLSGCTCGLEQADTSKLHASWAWRPIGFDQLPLTRQGGDFPRSAGLVSSSSDPELNEFARITVERQIWASLYATNGASECLENGYDPSDALWDFPTFCQSFCPS